ncbi:MAG: hypothetical protein ACKVQB_11905 [Bacteroidia bacterium]
MKNFRICISLGFIFYSLVSFSQTVEWQYFKMNGTECRIFTTKGNSRIIVPANCFWLDGKPYQGSLTIAFKEYKDQADFILGGLTLRYEVNGKLNTLQSGGMFEIDIKSESAKTLSFAPAKTVTVKFAIDPRFDVAGLEPFYFDPATKRWVKNTRFGKTKEANQPISDREADLWQDDPMVATFNDNPEWNTDDADGGCYTIQVSDPKNPDNFKDTLICPQGYNPLDGRYNNYLSDQAFKTMQIDKLGLFNYDKIFDNENNVPMFVKLKTKDGKPFELTDRLYVVYKLSNSVIYYTKDELIEKFSLLPRSDIKIFIYNADGTISKVPDSFWKNFDARLLRGKTIELPFETLKLARLTKEEFARATGL